MLSFSSGISLCIIFPLMWLMMNAFEFTTASSTSKIPTAEGQERNTLLETSKSKEQCLQALNVLQNAYLTGQDWAIQMFDSTGKIPDGIFVGASWSPGNPYECLETRIPRQSTNVSSYYSASIIANAQNEDPPLRPMYCEATLFSVRPDNPADSNDNFTLGDLIPPGAFFINGLCVPDVCTEWDVYEITNEYLSQFGLQVSNPHCFKKLDLPAPAPYQVVVMAMMCLFVLFAAAGTLFDIACRLLTIVTSAEDKKQLLRQNNNKVSQVLLAFSVVRNTESLLDCRAGPGTIGCLHGIRVITLSWIVLGHAYGSITDAPYFVHNPMKFFDLFSSWTLMPVINATMSVDTFFTMSGVLVSYLLLKELSKTGGRFRFVHYYVHRYVRLTPMYAFAIGFYTCVFPRLSTTPTSLQFFRDAAGGGPLYCTHWWAYLLYIDNLILGPTNSCIGQAWYLPNDMQMYALAPAVVIPLFYLSRRGKTGKTLSHGYLLLLMASSVAIGFGILHKYHIWGTSNIAGFLGVPANPPRRGGNGGAHYYNKPWCRFGPYVVGIYAGFFLFLFKDKRPHIPSWLVAYLWTCTVVMNLAIVYGLVDYMILSDSNPRTLNYLPWELDFVYSGMHRLAWSIGIAWVILACHWGYAGPVNSFLSWKAFQPLSKLSYCVYLVHTLVNAWIICSKVTPFNIDNGLQAADFLGSWGLSFLIAYVLATVFEIPVSGLEKFLFPKN